MPLETQVSPNVIIHKIISIFTALGGENLNHQKVHQHLINHLKTVLWYAKLPFCFINQMLALHHSFKLEYSSFLGVFFMGNKQLILV